MNIIAFQNRIINLDNVISIRRFKPGDWRPYSKQRDDIIERYEIWFEFNIPSSNGEIISPLAVRINYVSETDRDFDWDYIVVSMQRQPYSADLGSDGASDDDQ